MINPAPAPLAMAEIHTDSGVVSVPCEPINQWLAITPVFGMDADGGTWLDGTFSITHLPTGREFSEGSACVACCRNAGKEIAALSVDWAALGADNSAEWTAALDEDTRTELGIARAVAWRCDAADCEVADETPAPPPGGHPVPEEK